MEKKKRHQANRTHYSVSSATVVNKILCGNQFLASHLWSALLESKWCALGPEQLAMFYHSDHLSCKAGAELRQESVAFLRPTNPHSRIRARPIGHGGFAATQG